LQAAATHLKLGPGWAPIDCLRVLSALPLQSLELTGFGFGQADLMVLASWRSLRELKWEGAGQDVLTDAQLVPVLAAMPQLEALKLWGSSSQPGSPDHSMNLDLVRAALEHCRELRELFVDACQDREGSGQAPCQTAEAHAVATSMGRQDVKLYVRTH